MKTFVLLSLLTFAAAQSEAQLLKRIKDKAVQGIDTKSTNSSNSSSSKKTIQNGDNVKSTEEVPAKCSFVFTLGNDGRFFHDESRIIAKSNLLNSAFVITNTNKKFFLIEDGKPAGPFASVS